MRKSCFEFRLLLVSVAAVTLGSMLLAGQETIVIPEVVRSRLRQPTSGHVGSIGRKLPLHISAELCTGAQRSTVTFTIRNDGNETVQIPSSPNSGDFESNNPEKAYRMLTMTLALFDLEPSHKPREWRADLFVSSEMKDSLISLLPGHSVRFVKQLEKQTVLTAPPPAQTYALRLSLYDQKVSQGNGEVFENTREVGSSTSDSTAVNFAESSCSTQPGAEPKSHYSKRSR
jgi:hypothetical protein